MGQTSFLAQKRAVPADNLQKLLKDCMTQAGFWKDDAQVVSELCEKFWAEKPGIYIRISRLED